LKKNIKLFVTIKLKTGLKVVDVNIEKPVNIIELLQIVSDIIDYDLVKEFIENDSILPGIFIQLDGEDIHHLNNLDTQITKSTTISIFSSDLDE
jgi:hypothetical protein